MAISALGTLVWRHPLATWPKSAAPIGAVFTALAWSPAPSGQAMWFPGGSGKQAQSVFVLF